MHASTRISLIVAAFALCVAGADPALAAPPATSGDGAAPARFSLGLAPATPAASRASVRPADAPRLLVEDLRELLRPSRLQGSDAWDAALGLATVGVAASLDHTAYVHVSTRGGSGARSAARKIRPLGTWGGIAAMLATWGVGLASGSADTAATGRDGLEAVLIADGLITTPLKYVAGRARPTAGEGPHHWRPFSGQLSFPSGEATEAFAIASVVDAHSDSVPLKVGVWTLAAAVGWERMQLKAHWLSDVVAGGLIGAAVGRWLVRRHTPASRLTSVTVQPAVVPGGGGLRIALKLR